MIKTKNDSFLKKSKPQTQQPNTNRSSLQSARSGRIVVAQVSSDVWNYENDW